MPVAKRVEKFAWEPVAFHLHKNGNFFERIKNRPLTRAELNDKKLHDTIRSVTGSKNEFEKRGKTELG